MAQKVSSQNAARFCFQSVLAGFIVMRWQFEITEVTDAFPLFAICSIAYSINQKFVSTASVGRKSFVLLSSMIRIIAQLPLP